jgi:hypothetical protein
MANVAPKESAIASQVRLRRRPNRTAAPRKSAKKRTSVRPSWAADSSPGTRRKMLRASKTSGRSVVIVLVGPRATEKRSTGTIRRATSRTHQAASKNDRNHQPTKVAAASLAKFAAISRSVSEKSTARRVAAAAPRTSAHCPSRSRKGRASHTSPNVAGTTSNATNKTSISSRNEGSSSATAE